MDSSVMFVNDTWNIKLFYLGFQLVVNTWRCSEVWIYSGFYFQFACCKGPSWFFLNPKRNKKNKFHLLILLKTFDSIWVKQWRLNCVILHSCASKCRKIEDVHAALGWRKKQNKDTTHTHDGAVANYSLIMCVSMCMRDGFPSRDCAAEALALEISSVAQDGLHPANTMKRDGTFLAQEALPGGKERLKCWGWGVWTGNGRLSWRSPNRQDLQEFFFFIRDIRPKGVPKPQRGSLRRVRGILQTSRN